MMTEDNVFIHQVKILGAKDVKVNEGESILLEAEVPAEPACEEIRLVALSS